jgi:hypothetical protein
MRDATPSPDLRKGWIRRRQVLFEGCEPGADALSELFHCDAAVFFRIGMEAAESAAQKGCGADEIPALMVMESGGGLDQGLEEGFLRFGGAQPDGFPELVSFEELPIAIAAQSFSQAALFPVHGHVYIIRAGLQLDSTITTRAAGGRRRAMEIGRQSEGTGANDTLQT